MDIKELYDLFIDSSGVTTDSRNVKSGEIFFAIRGENFNGNLFAATALDSGAKYAVVDEVLENGKRFDPRIIVVSNALETLQKLAAYHRRILNIPIIAVTGTNGKTTTKELISTVLSTQYNVCYTVGNLNNHIGVPLTLLRFKHGIDIGVVEMGASSEGEIALLCEIAMPDYGLITNVGKAHLQGFGSFEGVVRAKSELYNYLDVSGGTILYNNDNPSICNIVSRFTHSKKRVGYGLYYDGGSFLDSDEEEPFLNIRLKSGVVVKTHLVGRYNADNVMAALAAGALFGITEENSVRAISGYVPSNNRSQLIVTAKNRVIMDAYNANPASMIAALDNFSNIQALHKVAIIGDMFELGEDSLSEHISLLKIAESRGFSDLIVIGTEFSKAAIANNFANYFYDIESARSRISGITDSLVLLKGSRGIALEKLLPLL